MPRLSIVITAYNIEQYIEQCLDSVAAQTVTDFEALVVDDGSTDTTPELITAHARRDPRFVPVLLPGNSPGGVATAANAGLDRATGTWVGFVDGDDFVEPQMFQRLMDAATSHDADLTLCRYDEVDASTGAARPPADEHRWHDLTAGAHRLDPDTRRDFLRLIAVPWRKLYRRTLLEDPPIRFPVGDHFFEDNPFHWFVLLSASSIAVVPEVLCHHRVARAGQTMATADERLMRIFDHYRTIHKFLVERDLTAEYHTTLLGWVVSQLEWISRRTPPDLHRTLYDRVAPILAEQPPAILTRALAEGGKGEYAHRLSLALAGRRYRAYQRVLAGRPATTNPIVLGVHHLRRSGPRRTARMTGRYLRARVPDRLTAATPARKPRSMTTNDVMFGLTVLQHQLRGIEASLTRIESRVDRIESAGDEQ